MTFQTRNLEELSRLENPPGTVIIHVRNPTTHKDHYIPLTDVKSSSNYETWDPEKDPPYEAGNRVTWNFKLWELKVGGDGSNIPVEGAHWTEVSSADLESLQSIDTSVAAPIINMGNLKRLVFKGSDNIDEAKTFSVTNDTSALEFYLIVILDDVFGLTFPANFKMSDPLWNPGTKTWTPEQGGTYRLHAIKDDANWYLHISTPYY